MAVEACLPEERLKAYVSGELDATTSTVVESHLEHCDQCCQNLYRIVDSEDFKQHQFHKVMGESSAKPASSAEDHTAYRLWTRYCRFGIHKISHPASIGRYQVERLLGSGGFGHVYLAIDATLERKVAIKVSHLNTEATPKQISAILAEAKTVASLDHPHIVPLYDVGSTQDFPVFLVSKWIDGNNLAEHDLAQAKLSEVVNWITHVAEALAYAHDMGVIHRDVKPQNILLDANGHACLTDFGLAWHMSRDLTNAPRAGTPAYMSPEQKTKGHAIDHRSDIYSLGKVLQELLQKVAQHQTTHESPTVGSSSTIPEALVEICQRCTAETPGDRYDDAHKLASSLQECAIDQGWIHGASSSQTLSRTALSRIQFVPVVVTLSVLAILAIPLSVCATWWNNREKAKSAVQAYVSSSAEDFSKKLAAVQQYDELADGFLQQELQTSDSYRKLLAQVALLEKQPDLAVEIAKSMLRCPAGLALEINRRLYSHKELREFMLQASTDDSLNPSARLNAYVFLANAFPDDPMWQEGVLIYRIAHLLQSDLQSDLQSHATGLAPIRGFLARHFKEYVAHFAPTSSHEATAACEAWLALVRNDIDEVVELIVMSTMDFAERTATQYVNDSEVRARLQSIARQEPSPPSNRQPMVQLRRRVLAAYALFHMQSPEEFFSLWRRTENPDLTNTTAELVDTSDRARTLIAESVLRRNLLEPVTALPKELKHRLFEPHLNMRRQMFHSMFQNRNWLKLSNLITTPIREKAKQLIVEEFDPGMHSYVYFLLKGTTKPDEWSEEKWFPKDQVRKEVPGRPWSINSLGMTMIDVQNCEEIDHDFCMSACEVSFSQFQQFAKAVNKHSLDERVVQRQINNSIELLDPQNWVSWYDCAAFCNWLSRNEGLDECYVPNAAGQYAEGMELKPNYIQLNGYRLPTNMEWQIGCLAGAKTPFSSGFDEAQANVYMWVNTGQLKPMTIAIKPPNALGFFDIQGNLSEWILDVTSQQAEGAGGVHQQLRVCRGGDYLTKVVEATIDDYTLLPVETRASQLGFRIARTIKRQ